MICDKYTLVSLFITNTVNIIQFILYNTCMIMNKEHPDIYRIRSLIYTKLLYDIFSFYKLYICFVNLNNRLTYDLIDFIAYGSRFVHITQIPSILTYYRIHTSYDQIQTYTNPLMFILYMMNYYISYIVVYSCSIIFLGTICYIFINRIIKVIMCNKTQSNIPIFTNDICSICLNTNCNYKTICSHSFHVECISQWVAISNKYECPICRTNIRHPKN
jgi:hypothetical protein